MAKPTTAFLFPGQGSQSVGMLQGWLADEPVVTQTFQEAGEALGYDLGQLVTEGPAEALNATERTQPALLTASVALWRVWRDRGGPEPDYLAGHSLGEYSALVAAGVLDFADTVRLVEARGRFMQAAVPAGEGAMAAIIGLSDDQVASACSDVSGSELCAPVNFNAPGQVVIAGTAAGVEAAIVSAKAMGARRALPLAVSAPSHCELMKPAAQQLAAEMSAIEWAPAAIPVVQNVDARPHNDVEVLRTNLVEQLYRPVQWVSTIEWMSGQGVSQAAECGPGKVLGGLVKRIDRTMAVAALETQEDLNAAVSAWTA